MSTPNSASEWWRSAVIYQVYIRSFADSDGDGLGDINGIRSRLPHLVDLGVDAIWINPWYPSPMADAGYDVSNYRDVEPRFGTLAEAQCLIDEAHALGLRVLLDIVPNHTSDRHPWFVEALTAGSRPEGVGRPGEHQSAAAEHSPNMTAGSRPEARARYLFAEGRGEDGEQAPNNWRSAFGGPAWTRAMKSDGTPGQWYLHLFAPEQPDLNWNNPEVRTEFESILRFWFDRGVDGFRIDVAHSLTKQDGLPDVGQRPVDPADEWRDHPHWDRDDVHAIYRSWRTLANSYNPPRVFVAEAWVEQPHRLARYLRPDELHTAFNFDYLRAPWLAAPLQAAIEATLVQHAAVGAPPTWVLSNHDVARHPSRYSRVQTINPPFTLDGLLGHPANFELGLKRARAAALLTLALPGSAYIYQGEELGLFEVEDLPDSVLQDPTWLRSGHTQRGRDGCRVPIPWSGTQSPFGFSPPNASSPPWLPQPGSWGEVSADALGTEPDSMLSLYRAALRIRRTHNGLGDGPMGWVDMPTGALAFERDHGFVCIVNLSTAPVVVPPRSKILLASGPLSVNGAIPSDVALWVQRIGPDAPTS